MVCAGSGGSNALRQFERIATGWCLKPVAPGLIVWPHARTPACILVPKQIGAEDLARCAQLGRGCSDQQGWRYGAAPPSVPC